MPGRSNRTTKLDLRLTPEAKQKLQAAASVSRRSVSEFVLESALVRAEEMLADRTQFGLDADCSAPRNSDQCIMGVEAPGEAHWDEETPPVHTRVQVQGRP